jgi:S1-C subfamily serine protease
MKRLSRLIAAAILLSGGASAACAADRAEVTIPLASADRVKAALANEMLSRGWRLVKDAGLQISFEHSISGVVANMLFSTPAGGAPIERVSFAVVGSREVTRVVADISVVSNAGTAFESSIDTNGGADTPNIQAALDAVSLELSPKRAVTLGLKATAATSTAAVNLRIAGDRGLSVAAVTPGGVAATSGVQVGDIILSFDGKSMNETSELSARLGQLKPGAAISAQILRNGEKKTVRFKF